MRKGVKGGAKSFALLFPKVDFWFYLFLKGKGGAKSFALLFPKVDFWFYLFLKGKGGKVIL